MGNLDTFWYRQLIGESPLLLVYSVGVVLAIRAWRRDRVHARLALASMTLALGWLFVQMAWRYSALKGQTEGGHGSLVSYSVVELLGMVLPAASVGLLLAAVFLRSAHDSA